MNNYPGLVIVEKGVGDVLGQVRDQLRPFSADQTVDPYDMRHYTPPFGATEAALRECPEGSFFENAKIVQRENLQPITYWFNWEIGGQYAGLLNPKAEDVFALEANSVSIEKYLDDKHRFVPNIVVSPKGDWLTRPGIFGQVSSTKDKYWLRMFEKIKEYLDGSLVMVSVHVVASAPSAIYT